MWLVGARLLRKAGVACWHHELMVLEAQAVELGGGGGRTQGVIKRL